MAVAVIAAYGDAARDRWVPPANGLVRIGVIVPTTGPYARLGGGFLQGGRDGQTDPRVPATGYQLVVRTSAAIP